MDKGLLFLFFMLAISGLVSAGAYPLPFIVNESVDVAIVYGTNPGVSSLEVVQAGNLQADLQGRISIELGDMLVKDTEFNSVTSKNLIVLGTMGDGCSNAAIQEVLEKEICDEVIDRLNIGTGEFVIESVVNPFFEGKIALLIVGYDVIDVINAVSYLTSNTFSTSVGSRFVKTIDSGEERGDGSCIDSDIMLQYPDGKNYYVKGKVTGLESIGGISIERSDYCGSVFGSNTLVERYCNDTWISSESYECPNGCEDGACKEESESELSKIIGEIQLVYDDDFLTYLDLIILGNLQTWLTEKDLKSVIKKNSEISNNFLDDKITVFIYNREAVIIYGSDVSSTLHLVWAGSIQAQLYGVEGDKLLSLCQDLVKSSDVNSDDLKEYLCKEIIYPIDEEEPIEIPDADTFICSGCDLDDLCYPLGYRKSGEYCSGELEFMEQSEEGASCDNNFECKSNVCVDDRCVSGSLIRKIIEWFKRLFGIE